MTSAHKPSSNQSGPGTASVLLIISGGIAAYKSLDLIRALRRENVNVRTILTESAHQFVTPLSVGALSENQVFGDLFNLKDEREIGHIQLSRQSDLIIVCPATANIMAKMAHGIADDLASTILLATDKPVLITPAMNVRMWNHAATRRNLIQLHEDGIHIMRPAYGAMACGEVGEGRLPPIEEITNTIRLLLQTVSKNLTPSRNKLAQSGIASQNHGLMDKKALSTLYICPQEREQNTPSPSLLQESDNNNGQHVISSPLSEHNPLSGQPAFAGDNHRPLYGKHILVTAGPTREAIDPVRYIANRSSGKQGFAIAEAAANAGARVTLVSGPVSLETPLGVVRIDVESALEMERAAHAALPADVAIMVAAVADWRIKDFQPQKIKKKASSESPKTLEFIENPDILMGIAQHPVRPNLIIGFAAETEDLTEHARTKRLRKGADWIVANNVSVQPGISVMGGDDNIVELIKENEHEKWNRLPKYAVASRLIAEIIQFFDNEKGSTSPPNNK